MDIYEKFRIEFESQIQMGLDSDQRSIVMNILDNMFCRYTLTSKETALTSYQDQVNYIVNLYLATRKLSGFSNGSISIYKGLLPEFFNMIGKPPSQVVPNDIRTYIYYQKSRGLSDRTLDNYRNYIASFFKWAYNEGFIDRDPSSNVDKIKYVRNQRKALSKIEIEELRRACADPRDLAIVDTFLSTGCRVSEVQGIKLEDIDWSNGAVKVLGKGKKYRTVFLNAKAEVSIKNYFKECRKDGDSEYLFCGFRSPYRMLSLGAYRGIVADILSRTDIKYNVTPHILRHTFATQALAAGMNIEVIQILLGHADLRTTMVYAKINIEDLKHAHNKYVV